MIPAFVPPKQISIFASGRGSNFQAIQNAITSGQLNIRIACIIGDRPGAGVFEIARSHGIPGYRISPSDYTDRISYVHEVLEKLQSHRTDWIVLAGYLQKIPDEILRQYPSRVVNIHPALLPSFGGKGMYGSKVHQSVIDYGVKITGVTVHLVDSDYDHGPILMQRSLEVQDNDTPEILAHRILEIEHQVYPAALKLLTEKQMVIRGRRVTFV